MRSAASQRISGVGRPRLNLQKVREISLAVPPAAEQKRIVAVLEEQFSRIDAGERALARVGQALQRMRAAVLHSAVTGRLISTDPTRWGKRSLPSLGMLDRGRSRHRPRNDPDLYGGAYPFIQTGEVTAADPWIDSYTQTYNDAGLAQSRLWPKGTLCITIAANIARTGILTFDGCFPDSVVGFVAFDGAIATRWVELVIRSMQDRLEQLAPATAQRNINLRVLRSLEIPFPSQSYQVETLAEYDRRISLISSLALTLTRSAQRADTLRSALLAEAFSGKLVRQDPDDEPASVLLQSIFDQRATLSGNRSRSKGPRRTKVGI